MHSLQGHDVYEYRNTSKMPSLSDLNDNLTKLLSKSNLDGNIIEMENI